MNLATELAGKRGREEKGKAGKASCASTFTYRHIIVSSIYEGPALTLLTEPGAISPDRSLHGQTLLIWRVEAALLLSFNRRPRRIRVGGGLGPEVNYLYLGSSRYVEIYGMSVDLLH